MLNFWSPCECFRGLRAERLAISGSNRVDTHVGDGVTVRVTMVQPGLTADLKDVWAVLDIITKDGRSTVKVNAFTRIQGLSLPVHEKLVAFYTLQIADRLMHAQM